MTDHQQAALTAMQDEIYRQLNCQYGDFNTPSNEEVKAILAAAEPHLRKKVRAAIAAEIAAREVAVASVHHFGFGKNGHKCLCGFSSPINRERTEHIIDMLGATKIAKGETK